MTIRDIAARAGVSVATVSRVINNTGKVKDETRKRIEAIIAETNFSPNTLAKGLVTKKTHTVGILMSVGQLSTSSLGLSINAISDVLNENGFRTTLANSHFDSTCEPSYFSTFKEAHCDGVIFFASHLTMAHAQMLKDYPIPVVIIGQRSPLPEIPCVIHDDYFASYSAAKYLIDCGHKKIAYIGCPLYDESTGVDRKHGFDNAMNAHHLQVEECHVAYGDFSMDSGYAAAKQIIEQSPERPTAIFAGSDFMAIGAIRYLLDAGLRVPNDISVMGFDDISLAGYYAPRITTVFTDARATGTVAAEVLLKLIYRQPVDIKKYITDFSLVERESVRRI